MPNNNGTQTKTLMKSKQSLLVDHETPDSQSKERPGKQLNTLPQDNPRDLGRDCGCCRRRLFRCGMRSATKIPMMRKSMATLCR